MSLTEEQRGTVGFDLEAARASISHYRIENTSNVDTESALKELVDQANLAEECLAEIERLRAALAESEKIVEHKSKSATHWYDEHLRAQTDLTQSKRVIEQQVAHIQELEDALVEYLAADIAYAAGVLWSRLGPRKEEYRERARQQLQAGGKIGTGARPPCWQITEERKAALWHAIKVLKENDIMEEPEEHLWDEEVTVLQAMLKEAE